MGEIVGYARVSSRTQDHGSQVGRLEAAGAAKIFAEKRSGLDGERAELRRCLDYVRDGDTLVVTKLDRLARSTRHLYQIVEGLTAKDVGFQVLDDPSLDTTTRTGKLVFGILATIAEFETALRKERQLEGIAKARAQGRVGGRPRLVTEAVHSEILQLRGQGLSIRKIAVRVGFSKATVQKFLSEMRGAATNVLHEDEPDGPPSQICTHQPEFASLSTRARPKSATQQA